MCFGFLGIQFGFALQSANISRIFQTLGANIDDIPILFIAAPITGLLVQPVVGYFSDKTWTGLGRRRPYFLWGAIVTTACLFVMPNSPTLWIAAGMLWILDSSVNVCMEPFRAFVGDMLPSKQRSAGYLMQTFFIGVGAVVASALPYLFSNYFDISNTAAEGAIPDSVRYSFYCGGIVLLLSVLWTVFRTKEYSPQELASFSEPEGAYETSAAQREKNGVAVFKSTSALSWCAFGLLASIFIYLGGWDFRLYILSVGLLVYGLIQLYAVALETGKIEINDRNRGFYEACRSVILMPRVMKQLSVVQFFSWFPLFALWIYATPAVTSFHFNSADPQTAAYNEGANWVGVLFAAYNGFSIVAALLIPFFIRRVGLKYTHQFNLLIGAVGLGSFVFISNPQLLMISMIGVGFAWASILSIPYALLADGIPSNKMGIYMGVFNFFIVIPQIVAASILGLMLSALFQNQAIYVIEFAAFCWLVAALSVFFVKHQNR